MRIRDTAFGKFLLGLDTRQRSQYIVECLVHGGPDSIVWDVVSAYDLRSQSIEDIVLLIDAKILDFDPDDEC